MEFITIDFETATGQRDIPCEIGLTFVQDGKIVDTKSSKSQMQNDKLNIK